MKKILKTAETIRTGAQIADTVITLATHTALEKSKNAIRSSNPALNTYSVFKTAATAVDLGVTVAVQNIRR